MKIIFSNFLAALLFVFVQQLNAQVISQLSFYSPLINTFDMKYTNNHLVVSQNGLLIFDVKDPTKKPKLVAQTTYPGSVSYSINVQGNYVYMALGNNGVFAVYDISNFNSPVLKGSVAIPATSFYGAGDVEPYGNHVFVSGFDSLYIVDVGNPASPFVANAISVAHNDFNGAEDIVIEGHALYLKTAVSVQVYDITNPIAPALISSINYLHTYNNMIEVDTINHRLFLSWATALKDFTGYDAYDLSNASSVNYLFSDSTEFSPGDFGIMDYSYLNNVLFASRGGSINAFDVSSNHHFVTNFSGQDIPNASVSIQVRDSAIFHSRGGGIEVLKYGTVPAAACNAPDELQQQVTGSVALLQWDDVPGALGYIVRYQVAGTNDWKFVPTKNNKTQLKNLLPNTKYAWQVRSVCKLIPPGLSEWSSHKSFRIRKNTADNLITITPNPVIGTMHIHLNDDAVSSLIIIDFTGLPLIKANNIKQDQNINCTALHPGTYLVQLFDNNHQLIGTVKMMKN